MTNRIETGCLVTDRLKGGTFLVTAFRYRSHGRGMDAEFQVLDPTNGNLHWVVDFNLKSLPDSPNEVAT
jgi:hypothetical protein